jgi:rsbT co-antagonist protein RsbR
MTHPHDIGTPNHLDYKELLELYRISEDDLERIRRFGAEALARMDELVERWYEWLRAHPEYDEFFSDPETLKRVQRLQEPYWELFMDGAVDNEYVQRRAVVGETHARIGLPLNTYFAGMNMFQELFSLVVREGDFEEDERAPILDSVTKLLHFDTAIVVDTYNHLVEQTLTAQSRSLMEMSTPVTEIWEGLLFLPVVGIIDSRRSREIMNATLSKIAETQARVFILDISGVGVVDTAVANHLIKITRATKLMGCETTISGVSPAIAQTIVDLGIDVGEVKTTATMPGGPVEPRHGRRGADPAAACTGMRRGVHPDRPRRAGAVLLPGGITGVRAVVGRPGRHSRPVRRGRHGWRRLSRSARHHADGAPHGGFHRPVGIAGGCGLGAHRPGSRYRGGGGHGDPGRRLPDYAGMGRYVHRRGGWA